MVPFAGRPWLLSVLLHLAVGSAVVLLLAEHAAPGPRSVRMRLVSAGPGGVAAASDSEKTSWWNPPSSSTSGPLPAEAPRWRDQPVAAWDESPAATVPVALDELLAGGPAAPDPVEAFRGVAEPGWSSPGGEGYQFPPLPPPGLSPPQGARWTLSLAVPGTGGFASAVEGLDSGHPELDRWLENYLRTVTFPSSPDGKDYRLRWVLRLDSGRPR